MELVFIGLLCSSWKLLNSAAAMEAVYTVLKARTYFPICPSALLNQGIEVHTLVWEESRATGGSVV